MTNTITLSSSQPPTAWNPDQIEIIKQQIAKGASDAQLALFAQVCQRTGLDPFSRQIYCIMRGGNPTIQVSIDGFRTIAARSGKYGGSHTEWCGEDGIWRDVWLGNGAPAAAKTTVYRVGSPMPFIGVAKYGSYQQSSNQLWKSMPDAMVGKVSESLALRKAFPAELSGLYGTEEMEQAQPEQVLTTYTHNIGHIADRRLAVADCFEALEWSKQQRQDWAQTISNKPSDKWELKTWDAGLVDLQERIDKAGATQNLIDAGADY
jgi:phage recombination protein Bet